MSDTDENTPLLPEQDAAEEVPAEAAPAAAEEEEDAPSPDDVISRHHRAAWIVDETTRGATIFSLDSVPKTRLDRKLYLFFDNLTWLRQATVLALLALSFLEKPAWCGDEPFCRAPDGSPAILSGLPVLPADTAVLINWALLLVLIFFAVFDFFAFKVSMYAEPARLYTLLGLLLADAVYVTAFGGSPPVRFAPFVRAFLPLLYFIPLRECTMSILAVVEPFFDVVIFVVLFTLLFGWVVTLFFHDVPAADTYFGDLGIGLYSAFTSLTTADWPMQIMAILDVNRASAVLFIMFILIGVFLLMNVLLAVVYNAYTEHIEKIVIEKLRNRIKSLGVAFDVLAGDDGLVTLPDVKLLFTELRRNKRHSHLEEDRVDLLFAALDDDQDKHLSRNEFMEIVKVLQYKFVIELQDITPIERYFPQFFASSQWQSVCEYVQSQRFTYVVDAFLLFNVIVVVIETTMDLRNRESPTTVLIFSLLECIFSFVYIGEMMLKISAMGFSRYWRDLGNQFDFWVTWLLLIATVVVLLPFVDNNPDIMRLFILLRCLRLITLLNDIPRFRRLVQVFSMLIPASVPLISLLFLSLFLFSALGVELFGGLIYKSNPALDPVANPSVEPFVGNDYWTLNFNDIGCGWFMLFSSIIVDYITEVPAAIASASRWGEWTKVFFLSSFVLNTLIVTNCVVAFVVDLFVEHDEADDEIDAKIVEDVHSRYGARRIRLQNRKNTADQVYAAMFKERLEELINDSDQPNL